MDRPGLTPLRTVGLTGGIGSGKSTVAQVLVSLGAVLVDTDAIAHALTQAGGAAVPAIVESFGPDALTAEGALNREQMRRWAFNDTAVKRRLEALLHPLIGQEAQRQAAAAGSRPVVFDVPLLTESSRWRGRVQRVLVVDCTEDTQAARVAQRPGWDETAARRVIAQQVTRQARRGIADAVIFNEGIDLAALRAEVEAVWATWGLGSA